MNIDVNRLLRIEAAVKAMLEVHSISGSKSRDPRYVTMIPCDKYSDVYNAFYGAEKK